MTHMQQKGFSLLELAIALAVLAVLSGGVLKGRELLKSAKVQAVVTDLGSIETALSAFQARYAALPGDFQAASGAGLGSTNGDANGAIDSGLETGAVFKQLQASGFLQGEFREIELTADACPTSTCLKTPFGDSYIVNSTMEGANTPAGALNVYLGSQIPASQLAEIDRKIDDGNPTKGALQVQADEATLCVTASNTWDETGNPNCKALYLVR